MKTLFGSKSKATLGLAALALLATSPAGAQNLTFATTGAFGGSASCTVVQCSFGGFTLGYNGMASDTYIVPSLVDLGSFFTQASGTTLDLTSIPAGVTFTLTIQQSGPTAGFGVVAGNVSGGLAYSPSRSTLVFTPTSNTVNIGGATYNLVTDNSGNINIAAPTQSNNPNPTIIKANATVSTVPEPATVALMGSGLLGLVGIGAVRRRANKA
jgi:hypothetical protein